MISFFRKLRWLTRSRNREDQLTAELRFHLEEEAEELEEAGVSEEDARWAARRELGNLGAVREQTRAIWTWTLLEQLVQDLRYAARTIRHSPTFTVVAALSLGLGIGANTAIYSFMDELLLRTLPVVSPASLVVLNWHITGRKSIDDSVVHNVSGHIYDDPNSGTASAIFPYPAFELLNKSSYPFSVLFAYHPARKLNVMIQNQTEIESGEYVSGGFFRGLGLAPAAGRLIVSDDDRAGATPVLVLSYALAQRRFGDVASAAGKTVRMNNIPFTVIGVAPPGFFGVDPATVPDFYLPMHADLLLTADGHPGTAPPAQRYLDEHYYWIEMMGRLRPGATMTQAQAILRLAFDQWVAATAANDRERKNLPSLLLKSGAGGLDNLRREYSHPMYILLAMVGMILAIACANIANLLLARATARRREMAVRLSMGAGRWRVLRQLLTESVLLASIGGAFGIAFAIWGIRVLTLLLAAQSNGFPIKAELNWHVLLSAAALTVITGLLFGLAPAIQATRLDAMPVLRETRAGDKRSLGGRRFSFSRILVVSQLAISLSLLVMAGLFVRTLSNLQSLETGFQRENILVFKLNARQAGHRDPEIRSFYDDLAKRFAAIPGVRSASAANSPLIGDGAWGWPVVPAGKEPPVNAPSGHGSGMGPPTATRVLATGPGFFTTMQIPLMAGREFNERDRLGSPPVAIVNQAWAKVNLEGQNPIGKRVMSLAPRLKPQEMEIIGLAKNARYDDLSGNFPAIVYMPFDQDLNASVDEMTFFLRTAGNPLAYASTVREIVHKADVRIPVTNLVTQAGQIDAEMIPQLLFARLCSGFAVLALTIACVGLYGTMSYIVERRTGEIGIRMALGAQRISVLSMVLRDVLLLTTMGLAIGLSVALGAAKVIESLLYGVKSNDPEAMVAAVAILLSAAFFAGYVPAHKASRIDPMTAVRHE
ncbi:MAG: ABC transporter permease [Acidobacteriota bacterium]|nr:ABC transporter permease [Acidobacteriota bacterium]